MFVHVLQAVIDKILGLIDFMPKTSEQKLRELLQGEKPEVIEQYVKAYKKLLEIKDTMKNADW